MVNQIKAKPNKKPGRKASGLRELPPEAARLAVSAAAHAAVVAALGMQDELRRATGYGSVPTLERLLRGDVERTSVLVADDGEVSVQPVLRAGSGAGEQWTKGLEPNLVLVGEAFVRDVERATIGKLTGSYGEGCGGGTAAEPERLAAAMQRLIQAQECLTAKERTTVWGVLVFGLSMTDAGWATDGARLGGVRVGLSDAAALRLEAALERMAPYYLARAGRA